jgi:hypothetical protein
MPEPEFQGSSERPSRRTRGQVVFAVLVALTFVAVAMLIT